MKIWTVFAALTIADKLLIGALLLLSLFSIPLTRWATRPGITAQIEANGAIYATLDLAVDQTIIVSGRIGPTRVVVRNRAVFVQSAPCKNQLCVRNGEIARNGQMIVCVPNQVIIRIIGANQQMRRYDAITH